VLWTKSSSSALHGKSASFGEILRGRGEAFYIAWTRESPSSGLLGGETGPKQLDRPSAQQDGPHGHHRHKPAGRAEIEDNDRHEGDEEGDQRKGTSSK
jgi:hypothetical protein